LSLGDLLSRIGRLSRLNPLWRGSLLPLGREAAQLIPEKKGTAVQSNGSKLPRHNYALAPLRSIANPLHVWLTGISSRLLMLMCAGALSTQKMVSAMSCGWIGSAPA